MRRCKFIFWVAMLLASCGGGGQPAQHNPTSPTLSGTATYDFSLIQYQGSVTAIGAAGASRTNTNSGLTNQFSVTLQQLEAPYALHSAQPDASGNIQDVYGVALGAGIANVTPLTTLLFAQLFGRDPAAAFGSFGTMGDSEVARLTDENLQAAQAQVSAYLQTVLGVIVPSTIGNFATTSFASAPGDPMFDTITALNEKLRATDTTLIQLADQIGGIARLCIEEQLKITIAGSTVAFCPSAKNATPEEADSNIIDYVFTTIGQDTLTVKTQVDVVLSVQYVVATGGEAYTCVQANCAGVALSAAAADGTRTIGFTTTMLAAAGGNAVLNGSLTGAIPGLPLPILPCDNNRYYAILTDKSVVANCIDTQDQLGLGGTEVGAIGAYPARASYTFRASTPNPAAGTLEIIMDGNESLLYVYFSATDPVGGEKLQFVCQESACNGVTLGPVTVDTNALGADTPVLIRTITLSDTTLTGFNPDGSSTNKTVTLKAAATTVYFDIPQDRLSFPSLADCAAGSATLSVVAFSGPFNFCVPSRNHFAGILDDGDEDLAVTTDDVSSLDVIIHPDGTLVSVRFRSNDTGGDIYACFLNCTGVTISAPDGQGRRSITFAGVILRESLIAPLPGQRTVVFTSPGPIAYPTPVPVNGLSGLSRVFDRMIGATPRGSRRLSEH